MNDTSRAMLAEFIGTFVFFTIGAGAVIITTVSNGDLGLLGVAFAHGIALTLVASIFGRISGAHFNPAVSIGLWVTGKIDTVRAAGYIVAQLAGGLLAGLLLRTIFTERQWNPTHLGTPAVAGGVGVGKAVLIEAVLTFVLLLAIWGTAVDPAGPSIAGFGIGLAVFADILLGGPLTGAAMNPARWFGTAVAAGFYENWWVYWVGPIAGACVASVLYRYVFYSEHHPSQVQTSIGHERVQEPPHA